MDNTNTSGEQNDRIQTYFLLATERSSFAMYGVRYIKETILNGRVARTNIPQF